MKREKWLLAFGLAVAVDLGASTLHAASIIDEGERASAPGTSAEAGNGRCENDRAANLRPRQTILQPGTLYPLSVNASGC